MAAWEAGKERFVNAMINAMVGLVIVLAVAGMVTVVLLVLIAIFMTAGIVRDWFSESRKGGAP